MSKLGPCKGINNKTEDFSLPDPSQQDPRVFVRNAVNADFNNKGNPKRRKGITKVYSGSNMKDAFDCELGELIVEGLSLRKFNADNTSTTIYQGITGTTFTFDYFNGIVYFSDGVICLKISASGVTNWGMEPPPAMTLSTTEGSYGAGVYLACCCWVDGNGVESGISPILSISALANSGFIFSNLPAPSDPQISTLRIYLSTANGKEMYHVADTTAESYTITAGRYDEGNPCESQFIYPPPPGKIVRHYKGRAYVADAVGNVFYSEPFAFDRFMLKDNYIPFPAPVDIMEPTPQGIFVAYGNKTDFLEGQPEDGFTVIEKLEYGAVFGTGGTMPNSEDVYWQSQRGFVIGSPDGQVRNMQEQDVAVDMATSGATLIKEYDGLRQFIASLKGTTYSTLAAKSWINMETTRRG